MNQKNLLTRQSINASTALELVRVALEAAQKMGVNASVVVCGPELQMLACVRGDFAPPHSLETAKRKAQSAASRGKASGTIPAELAVTLPLASGNVLTNLLGALPILHNGFCVGAIGVGGGSPAQDVEIAEAALNVVFGAA